MKKSEVKSEQSAGEKLEAPVRLTPEQLETVVAGFAALLPKGKGTEDPTVLTGAISTRPVLKQLF
jgi:hypothetical protein